MRLATVEHNGDVFEFTGPDRGQTIVVIALRNVLGGELGREAADRTLPLSWRAAIDRLARKHLGAGAASAIHFESRAADPWRDSDSRAEGLGPTEVTDEHGVTTRGERPTASEATAIVAAFDRRNAYEHTPGFDPRTRLLTNPDGGSTVPLTVAGHDRQARAAASWTAAGIVVAEQGRPGSPQFMECVRLLVVYAPDSAGKKAAAIARAYLVPHAAVAGPDIHLRAAEYVAWALDEGNVPVPGWWPHAPLDRIAIRATVHGEEG